MLDKKQQEYLSELIDNDYSSPEELAMHLDMGIEMFFYIEEDVFDKRDVQSVVFAIRKIRNALRKEK